MAFARICIASSPEDSAIAETPNLNQLQSAIASGWEHVLTELDSDVCEEDEERFRDSFAQSGGMWVMDADDGLWGERLVVEIRPKKIK